MLDAYHHHVQLGVEGAHVLFLFHGTGGDERQFLPIAQTLMPTATLIAPRGDVSENGAARFFRRQEEGVYDMEDLGRATEKMVGFVAAHMARHRPGRVIGLGYSNGANILASLMFSRPDLFDAAVLMHPLIPWTPEPSSQRARVLITAAERDPICPASLTVALEKWFENNGSTVEAHWHPGGHEVAQSEIAAIAAFLGADPVTAR